MKEQTKLEKISRYLPIMDVNSNVMFEVCMVKNSLPYSLYAISIYSLVCVYIYN